MYDVLDIRIRSRIGIHANKHREIKTTNSYPLVQQIIDIHNTNYSIFQFEEKTIFEEKCLSSLYKEIDISADISANNPHTNILLTMAYALEKSLLITNKYSDHPIIKKYLDFGNLTKVSQTQNITLFEKHINIFKASHPDVATNWIKYIFTVMQMANNNQDIEDIAGCSKLLFPTKKMQMYNDIQHLVELCSALHKMRFAKRYEYADYPVNIPDYAEFTDMFDHLIQSVRLAFESEIKKDCSNYLKYSKKLVETNSRNLSATMFSDYLCTLFNSRNYAEVYTMFKQNKKYIMHFLHKQNYTMSRLNLISTIIGSGYMTNKNITRTEFTEILSDINPKDYVNSEHITHAYKHTTSIIEAIKKRDLTITSMGFDITARSEIGEICLICLENIDDNNTDTIKCRCCERELGHISCILTWIKTKNTCPNCRASVEKRLSIHE